MELFDEDLKINKKASNKRSTTIILVLIIFFIIMILATIGVVLYLKQTAFVVKYNGQESNTIKNILNINENNPMEVYIPIKKFAKILGYQSYDGNYMTKSEERNECYVQSKEEIAMFSLNSKTIYKTLTTGEVDFQKFEIDEPVKAINGELYTTIEGVKKAFNIRFDYDMENNKIEILTIPYMVQGYTQFVINNGYSAISEDFTNQKACLEGMLIVKKSTENNGDKMAVLDVSGGELKNILEPKYDNIQYLEHTNDFLVTADGKKGIVSKKRETVVRTQYDDIILLDYDKRLYGIELMGKYGIIDFSGKEILPNDYSAIGLDITSFKENNIKSKYILADRLIPLRNQENFWGFFDTTTKTITDFKYTRVGYITSNNRAGSGYSLLVVPDYNVIVVEKNRKYSVITSSGEEIEGLPFVFDSIYLSISGGQTSYILEYNSEKYNLTEQLDGLGYGKNNNIKNSNTKQENNNEAQDNNQQQENNENQEAQNNNQQQENNENQEVQNNNQQQENNNQEQNNNENNNEQNNQNQEQQGNNQENNMEENIQ